MATSASSRKAKPMTDPNKPASDEKNTSPDTPTPAPEKKAVSPIPAKHATAEVDKETEAGDVKALLARHTFDGKGDNAVPPASFNSFATAGVEKVSALKDPETVAQEVLHGNWGPNAEVVVERLTAAGYEGEVLDAIEREFNQRKSSGAPSAF